MGTRKLSWSGLKGLKAKCPQQLQTHIIKVAEEGRVLLKHSQCLHSVGAEHPKPLKIEIF